MWEQVPRDEQETIINVDYYEKKMTFYTSRKSVAQRLKRKVGEPTSVDKINGRISGVTYVRGLHEDDVKKFFSISSVIGSFRKLRDNEEIDDEEESNEED